MAMILLLPKVPEWLSIHRTLKYLLVVENFPPVPLEESMHKKYH
jgi:hypothetical protein